MCLNFVLFRVVKSIIFSAVELYSAQKNLPCGADFLFMTLLFSYYLMSEGEKCVEHQFEVLQAERNTYNRTAEDYAKGQMRECYLDASEDYPQHIHNDLQASCGVGLGPHLATERPQGKHSQTHDLNSEGYAYNGQAQHQSAKQVAKRDEQTSKNYPDNVANKFHSSSI